MSTGSDRPGRPRTRRQRVTPFALLVGLAGSALTSGGMAATYSALGATLQDSVNSTGSGAIVMQETNAAGDGGTACSSANGSQNSTTCSQFNKYGGTSLRPGMTSDTTSVRIYNTGTLTADTFSVVPGPCSVTSNPLGVSGNVCGQMQVIAICTRFTNGSQDGTASLFPDSATLGSISGTAVDLRSTRPCSPTPGGTGARNYVRFDFSVALKSDAGSEVQGQTAGQTLKWTFSTGS